MRDRTIKRSKREESIMANTNESSKKNVGIQGDHRLVISEPTKPPEGKETVLIPNVSVFDGSSDTPCQKHACPGGR